MTVRVPVKYDGSNIVEMSTGDMTEYYAYIAYLYAQAPTVTLTVVSSSGTLTPDLTDTRLQAGAVSNICNCFYCRSYNSRTLSGYRNHIR
jgi:hypothetical protein